MLLHAGVDDIDLAELPAHESLAHHGRYSPGALHAGLLRHSDKAPVHRVAQFLQRQGTQPPHHAYGRVCFLLQHALSKFQNVVVIGAGQSLIAADDQIPLFAAEDRLPGAKIAVLQLRQVPQDLRDQLLRLLKVRQRFGQGPAGLFHLGGGD